MRPVKLALEGFTSFASRAEVDFRGLDLFSIWGQTGAGKSSILDGILFALYGETPRGVSVAELRTQGAPAMKVQLEFAVADREYMVSRVYRGKGAVDFQFHTREGSEWKLSANQVKQGSEEIERIVGLDFAGFTRAVILPQGAFDEFLRGDTQQRTRILNDLLSLNLYQTMMQSANARSSRLKDEAALLRTQLERDFAEATAEHLRLIGCRIAEARARAGGNAAKTAALEPVRKLAAGLRQERDVRLRAEREHAAARADRERNEKAVGEVKRRIEESARQKEEAAAAVARSGFDPAGYEQLVEVNPVARQIEMLKSDLSASRTRQKELAAQKKAAEEASQRAVAALGGVRVEVSHEVVAAMAAELRRLAVPDAEARQAALTRAMEEAEREWDHVRAADLRAHLKAGQPCPVCDQIVKAAPAAGGAGVLEEVRARREKASRELRAFEVAVGQWRDQVESARRLVGDASDLEGLAARLREASIRGTELERKIEEVARVEAEIRQKTEALRAANQEFQRYPEWNALPLEELEENLKQQRAARDRHETLRRQAEEAAKAQVAALEESSKVQASLLYLERMMAEKKAQIEAAAARITELEQQLGAEWVTGAGDEDRRVEQAAKALHDEAGTLALELGRLGSQREAIAAKIERATEIQGEIASKTERSQCFHELGLLLNAKNFIAYVQRQMLERLARLASEQLATLSDGRYRLTLSRDSNEFFVEDQWNAGQARSAKTLSGGESFLASLALALALSDSVTGFGRQARLESLFLDEGFSTLDSDSLQTAIEAVQTLAANRRMVGVISHLPELAEQMPARILVDKSASGSTVRVETGGHSHSMVAGGL